MTQLLNDTFDILNARFAKEAININNWGRKKDILDKFLAIIDETERVYDEEGGEHAGMKMFLSRQTLEGFRMSVRSAISLTEEMFKANYTMILSGKWNQDILEVVTISY